ncbi:MAG: helix-hairpin-helix domain-containing protein [Desulfomonilaceae bacterium]|nr:helix-hairpin-helix domain-containing protein [Desulfomonilaceae bacterium]
MKPDPQHSLTQPTVMALIVLGLAALTYQCLPPVERLLSPDRSSQWAPERGDCVYQVFLDDAPLGTVCVDRPASIAEILRILGETSTSPRANLHRPIACNRVVKLSRESRDVSVEKLPGRVLLLLGRKIDVNSADAEDLTNVPGLGPALARRVEQIRDSSGPFARLEDLARVPGIGTEKIRRLEPYLRAGRSVGTDESQDVHAGGGVLDPTRRIDGHEMPNGSQVPH